MTYTVLLAGALKAAHVGISVINDPDLERRVATAAAEEIGEGRASGEKKVMYISM